MWGRNPKLVADKLNLVPRHGFFGLDGVLQNLGKLQWQKQQLPSVTDVQQNCISQLPQSG